MIPFPLMSALTQSQMEDDEENRRRRLMGQSPSQMFAGNYERDRNFRAQMPQGPGLQNRPKGYDQAFGFATGSGQGNPAFTPGNAYYGYPEAAETRKKMRDLVTQQGFQVPAYMNDQPTVSPERRMASPLTDALVQGPGDPIREQMMWRMQNPTGTRTGNTVMYSGNAGDGGYGPSMADRTQQGQLQAQADLTRYDKIQKEKELMGYQGGQMQAEAERARAMANAIPGQQEADMIRARAAAEQAAADKMRAETEQRAVNSHLPQQMPPPAPGQVATPIQAESALMQHPAGASVMGIVKKGIAPDGTISGSVRDMLAELDRNGAFNDPNIGGNLPGTIYKYWQPEIDRIMAGGLEHAHDYFNLQGLLTAGGFFNQGGGTPAFGGGKELEALRWRLANMFPTMYKANERKPTTPMDASGFGGYGSY